MDRNPSGSNRNMKFDELAIANLIIWTFGAALIIGFLLVRSMYYQ